MTTLLTDEECDAIQSVVETARSLTEAEYYERDVGVMFKYGTQTMINIYPTVHSRGTAPPGGLTAKVASHDEVAAKRLAEEVEQVLDSTGVEMYRPERSWEESEKTPTSSYNHSYKLRTKL